MQVLASNLKLDICILNLAHKELTDNSLASHLRDAPENSLILLEDVDAIFTNRSDPSVSSSTNGKSEGVTFSGLLNALDGVAAQEGRIFFMTTNHIEKLDPALIRPGRCDVKVTILLNFATRIISLILSTFTFISVGSAQSIQVAIGEDVSEVLSSRRGKGQNLRQLSTSR